MTDKLEIPEPDDINALIAKHGISHQQAAGLVHVSYRTWRNWCAPVGSNTHRDMPIGAWELLLIKLGEIDVCSRASNPVVAQDTAKVSDKTPEVEPVAYVVEHESDPAEQTLLVGVQEYEDHFKDDNWKIRQKLYPRECFMDRLHAAAERDEP
jgi:hypothetical protein